VVLQFEILIENLNRQTDLYKSLKPVIEAVREKADKTSDEMMDILKSSQDTIDAIGVLSDERRVMEEHLSKTLGLEMFDRMSIEGCVRVDLLKSFDEAVSNLKDSLETLMERHAGVIDALSAEKVEIGSKLKETSKGKISIKGYYDRCRNACFIDRKSK